MGEELLEIEAVDNLFKFYSKGWQRNEMVSCSGKQNQEILRLEK